ncbi:MAG: AAA family ATPase [Treponema sp.]|uniref:ATP-dependent nuclease n=1 Tax=Treponema sp. TaxID=166 RepID=UPI0025F8A1D6|nr:AAA family ATPase [Treponema sp.]MBQ8680588.1 AAA family ATPase [Treponema sp.]
MKINKLIISGFKCFKTRTEIELEDLTCFIGTNSSGKSATLEALCRLFGDTNHLKTVQKTDFYVEPGKTIDDYDTRQFFIEAIISFPELLHTDSASTDAVPACFHRMFIATENDAPHCRIRLEAEWETGATSDGNLNYAIYWIISNSAEPKDEDKIPFNLKDKNQIVVHYIPATRNPENQIKNVAGTVIKRLFDSITWDNEIQETLEKAAKIVKEQFCKENGIKTIQDTLDSFWSKYTAGGKYKHISLTPIETDLTSIVGQINAYFSPGQADAMDSVEKLSDGTKSLFYLTLLNTLFEVENKINCDQVDGFDKSKINKPCLTLFALEEPENHLSPHYIGRIISIFRQLTQQGAQTVLTSHSASIVRRIEPEEIRYFRLIDNDYTSVKKILLPGANKTEDYKYVKEAVKAYPELYFSRLIIFGEGDSEELVIPRLAKWRGIDIDTSFVSFVPFAGRFVNHFWRLVEDLHIPYLTLLDFDKGRNTGGEDKIKYITGQLNLYNKLTSAETMFLGNPINSECNKLSLLQKKNVYFSYPIDIDWTMLKEFETEYKFLQDGENEPLIPKEEDANLVQKNKNAIASVLKTDSETVDLTRLPDNDISLYYWYRYLFLGRGKPISHLNGLLRIEESKNFRIPACYEPLLDKLQNFLDEE